MSLTEIKTCRNVHKNHDLLSAVSTNYRIIKQLVCFKRAMLQLLDKIKGPELLANTEKTISVSEFIFITDTLNVYMYNIIYEKDSCRFCIQSSVK